MYSGAVCLGGHVVSLHVVDPKQRLEIPGGHGPSPAATRSMGPAALNAYRIPVPNFCTICSRPVVVTCGSCGAPIPRPEEDDSLPRPFCGGCGSPLPWATREDRVNAMKAALSLETGLDEANRIDLDGGVRDPGGRCRSGRTSSGCAEAEAANASGVDRLDPAGAFSDIVRRSTPSIRSAA